MAIPRIEPPAGASGVGLPQPLAPSQAALVRRIFALQRKNELPAAIAQTARLADTSLLGHILADRYLSRPARVPAADLADWLGRYADLPDACAIYSLLLKRLPAGSKPPPAPACPTLASASDPMVADNVTAAARSARDAFVRGHDDAAYRIGRTAFTRSHGRDGQSAYVAGLAAWRKGEFAAARTLFEAASLADEAGPGLRAGAAFWAARAHLREGAGSGRPGPDGQAWRPWLWRAAAEPQTLHGMLARRILGVRLAAGPQKPTLSQADVDAIDATSQGRRAFALIQVGEVARADCELRLLWPLARTSPPLARALFLVAEAAGLNDLARDISGTGDADGVNLPMPALHPNGGFWLDPALVYAVAHVESNFASGVVSSAGANGLMQLMPVAAIAIVRRGDASEIGTRLKDPGENLRMGQQYLLYLSRRTSAGDDLLHVLASYNSGPGAVQRWDNAGIDDPMLYIEAIPCAETRRFVQHTLMNIWRYAARFHSPAPSLDALAAGEWPRFTPEIRNSDGHWLH
jgi:soluble lytic murein transglycosylase-like protein